MADDAQVRNPRVIQPSPPPSVYGAQSRLNTALNGYWPGSRFSMSTPLRVPMRAPRQRIPCNAPLWGRTDSSWSRGAPARSWKCRPQRLGSTDTPRFTLLLSTSSLARNWKISVHLLITWTFLTSSARNISLWVVTSACKGYLRPDQS